MPKSTGLLAAPLRRLGAAVVRLLIAGLLALGPLAFRAPAPALADPPAPPAPQPAGPAAPAAQRSVFLPIAAQPAPITAPVGGSDGHALNDYDLAALARQRNEAPFRIDPRRRAAVAPTDLVRLGQWGPVVQWPFVFASAASLPDGRIIAWGGNNTTSFSGGTYTYGAVWDPATGQFLSTPNADHSMFCAMPTVTEDGRIFVNGGDGTRERTSIFDYRTNQWRRAEDMNTGRWYPGSVALPSGQVYTAIGDPGGPYPEVYTPGQGWSLLTGANLQAPILNYTGYQNNWLPYLHLAPNGKILHSGPTPQMNYLDPAGNGAVASAGLTNSWYPKYSVGIMYDEGKLLVAGGAVDNTSTAAGTNLAKVIDLNGATPVQTSTNPMANMRKFNNGVVLPTGEVLVIGGNTSGVEFSDAGTVLTPEIWNPASGAWRSVADMSVPRNYHSVALLMPDGRVWSGGGGLCACAGDHPDAQIYSPPYLFNADGTAATRPAISAAPSLVAPGRSYGVQATPGIQRFTLIKMSAITHNLNSDLRALRVPFTSTASGEYQLTLSSNANVLTPGYWMLFAVDSQGVPSVAKMLQVLRAPVSAINPGAQKSKLGETISLPIAAKDVNGGALSYSASGLPAGLTIDPASGVISGVTSGSGNVNASVTARNAGGESSTVTFRWSVDFAGTGSGQILRQWWAGIAGAALTDLTGNAAYPNSPSGQDLLSSFEAPTNWADNYGTRVRGYVHAPVSGQYTFWIASDDNSQLLLSTDATPANARAIASVPAWTNSREWAKYAEQKSVVITLQAGQKYYTEALQKEGGGGDNLAVAWQIPGGAQELIDGRYLSPYIPEQPFRYLKLEALSEVNGNPWTSAAELNVLDSYGNPLSRAGWTITADSQETQSANNAATNALDGSAATFWHTQWGTASPPPPHWAVIDMKTATAISGLRYLPRQDMANGRILAYRLWLSQDGVSWNVLAAQGSFANSAAEQTVQFRASQTLALTLDPIVSPPKPVSTAIGYTAVSRGGSNPRYKWLFGDGSAETVYSSSASSSHSYSSPGLYVVKLTASDDSGVEQSITFVQAVYLPPSAGRPAASGPIAYEQRSGANSRIWAVNPDNDSVSVFDAVNRTRLAEIAVGKAPRSLAIAPSGRVWVVNKGAATISMIDPATLAVAQTVSLPYGSAPFGIVFAPGGAAYVALEAGGKLLRLDPASGAQTGNLEVGPNVRHLSVSGDGASIYVSRFISPRVPGEASATPQPNLGGVSYGGEVIVVSAATLTASRTIVLRSSDQPDTERSGRGIPNYLGPAMITPDGQSAWVPSKQDNIMRGTLRDGNNLTFQNTVRAISSRLNLAGGAEDYPARIDLDNAGVASAALFDRYGNYLFVALETNRQVAVIDAYARRELFRFDVGRAPQGLAISPDGLTLYVQNFMDRTVSAHDLTGLINRGERSVGTLATLPTVVSEKLTAQVLLGKQLFYDARDRRLSLDSYMSCASCHNDGGGDGRVWDLTGFGEGLRNTIELSGRAGMGHGFLHWSGNFDEVQDFEGQIRALAGGTGLMSDADFNAGTRAQPLGDKKAGLSADLDALAGYLASLVGLAPSPQRAGDGSLTADGAAGKLVFQNANCALCHGGTAFSNSGAANLSNIGTLKPSSGARLGGTLSGIDIPTLRGLWASGPYLHDGSAATLADAVQAHNTVALSSADLTKLVAYLQQIGSDEPAAPGSLGSGQILREWWTGIAGTAITDLANSTAYPYQPSGSAMLTSFEAPSNWADNYGTRVRGYVHAPVSGQYTFWIAGDDNAQLLLSTDATPANARAIASVPGWTNPREWAKYAEQKSVAITLQAGQKYYIEALQKEGGGGDNLAVAWQIPGGAQAVIAGTYLSPYQPPALTNLARARAATQSSTYNSGGAGRAVDGNTNGSFSAGSVTHTNYNTNAWWQVDLGASYRLDSIQLWNRTDCCASRLSNFYVFVSSSDMTGRSYSSLVGDSAVWKVYISGQAPAKLNLAAYPSGRYVRVQLAGTNYLSLAEVQVWGR